MTYDDVIVCYWKMPFSHSEFISPLLWPPSSPNLNPVDYSVWWILQEVYKRRTTDLDDLKHRIRTEWTKLDHAVIAAAVHQGRRHKRTGNLAYGTGNWRQGIPGLV